jgi:Rho family, other
LDDAVTPAAGVGFASRVGSGVGEFNDSESAASNNTVPIRTSVKLYIVGDTTIGKSCICEVFAKGEFPKAWEPSIFERYVVGVELDGKMADLEIVDHTGLEECRDLRALLYPDTDVVVMCFSITSLNSMANISHKVIAKTSMRHIALADCLLVDP